MKSFKSYINEAAPNAKPKAKGEADFVAAHKVEITDITNQGTEGSANVITKPVSGKRKADRTDNKQSMGEAAGSSEEKNSKNVQSKTYRNMMKESELSKKQTTMAHTIGKRFEKKGVGDEDKGGPYAIATAMVKDKPEAAKKAYDTIKSKIKEQTDAELLFKLFDDLNEENQQFFMQQLDEDSDALLEFAKNLLEE